MNRQKAKEVNKISREAREEKHKRRNIVVVSLETWNRVNNQQLYEPEDIVAVASCLADTHGYDIQQQLKVLGGEGQLKVWLESVKNFNVHQNAYFCIYYIQANHWVVFSFLEFESEIVVLYKDSRGGDVLPEIKKAISETYSKNKLLFKSNIKNNTNGGGCCGLLCLKNFEVILESLNERKGEFIARFESNKFCSFQEVASIREKFQAKLLHYVKDNIVHKIVELAKEEEFISSMNEFIELCVQYIENKDLSWNYVNVLKEEYEQKEKDSNYRINEERVKEAKEKFLGNDFIQELIQNSSKEPSSETTNKSKEKEFKLKIEKDFPEQTKAFIGLFSWIINFKDDKEREKLLQQISDKLGLEFGKIKQFFEIQRLRTESRAPDAEQDDSPEIRNAEELEKNLPPMADPEDFREEGVKTREELLEELRLGPTWRAASGEQSDRDVRESALGQSLSLVRDATDQRWRKASVQEVRKWAEDRRRRSSMGCRDGISAKDVEDTLAAICRAHQLTTGGQHLRDTQLIAALVCLFGEKGTLCQMATGEGKTAVVSVLAAAEVLLHNRQVDIVTTNHVLANEGFTSRRSFFESLGIKVSCNASKQKQRSQVDEGGTGAKACYAADVVYGDMATFQFDYLRHECERQGTRGNRSFGRVIVDEVDSMLIDNASHIAKLASPFPGMDFLRYVHIKIWQEASKATDEMARSIEEKLKLKAEEIQEQFKDLEHQLQKEFDDIASEDGFSQEELNAKGEELRMKRNDFAKHCQIEYEKYRNELYKVEIDDIKPRIKRSKPTQVDLIPAHLRAYASQMEDKWIDNALYAMYGCHENEQYVLRTDEESKETVVIPVDYTNTGVTLKNTQWSNGLHQFVQLKHNLRVTVESLTSSFISNVGYIKLFGNKVWGVTGTLGSGAETQLLSDAYDVSHAKIPTYKPKTFTEFGGIVVQNNQWANVVALDAFLHTRLQRSVLVICKTIKDVQHLEKNIKALVKMEKGANIKIKTYADENSSEIVKAVVDPGEIIIATNIAGRGTDLRTSKTLEEKGGLHVCVTFLPTNQRVEDQAFGRTGRQGNVGSAQIIASLSDVSELGLDVSPEMNFSSIKEQRDQLEQTRISEVQKQELRDIQFQDAIFNQFRDIYVNLKDNADNKPDIRFLAMDLKEKWAFWLHEKDFKKNHAARKTVDEEFLDFLKQAKKITGHEVSGKYCGGEIAFNPYYSIQLAEFFFNAKSMKESEKALLHAIQMDATNSDILHSAYLKLFEIEIEKGHQLFERFRKAMLEVAGFDLLDLPRFKENTDDGFLKGAMKNVSNFFSTQKDERYKERAKDTLEKAKNALEKDINYMKTNFFGDKSDHKENSGNDSSQSKKKEPLSNQDFVNILLSNDNPLLKQLSSRYLVLNTFHQHVLSLLGQIEKSLKAGSTIGLAVTTRVVNYLKKENFSKESMLEADLSEIGRLGLETVYAVREVHDVPGQVIRRAQGQIAAGLATAASGTFFPPALFVTAPLASTLISEGICDIVLELIGQGYNEFSEVAYVKGKIISYAISLITLGLSALSRCVSLLDEAIKCCKSLASILKKCPYMTFVCKKLANIVEWLGMYFQRLKYLAQFEKLNKVGMTVSRMQAFTSIMQSTAKSTLKSLVGSIITEKVVTKQLEVMLNGIKPEIQKSVQKTIETRVKEKDLEHIGAEDLNKLTNDILVGSYGEIACDVLKEVGFGLLRHSNSWVAKISSLLLETVVSGWQIYKYTEAFCEKLKMQLKKTQLGKEKKSKDKNSGKELREYIIYTVTEKIYGMIVQIVGRYANTIVVNPVINTVWNLFDSSEKENKQREEELNKSFDEILEAYEKLGVDFGATDEEIKKAWMAGAKKYHPDSHSRDKSKSKEENSQQFIRITEARDLLFGYNKMVAGYEKISVSKAPAHGGNIETLSKAEKQHIVIINEETGESKEFGKEYKNIGKPTITMRYKPPSQDGDGHYSVLNSSKQITPSGDYNCFYDAYAAANDNSMPPDRARKIAEKLSVPNLVYGSLNTLSQLLNTTLTKQLYLEAQTALLVGGRDPSNTRRLEKDELYPYEREPNTNTKEERRIKRVLSATINHLTLRNEKHRNFNPNRAVGNRLKSMGNVVPAFGSDSKKQKFMLGVLCVRYSDNTEFKIICSSGTDVFFDRQKKYFDREVEPEAMKFQNEGYSYCDPGNVKGKKIFDLKNMEELKKTFNKGCAAQKAFYEAGEHTKLKLKQNRYLKVKEVIMRECYFKKGLKDDVTTKDIHYIASCTKCEEVLPLVTGLPPRNPSNE